MFKCDYIHSNSLLTNLYLDCGYIHIKGLSSFGLSVVFLVNPEIVGGCLSRCKVNDISSFVLAHIRVRISMKLSIVGDS